MGHDFVGRHNIYFCPTCRQQHVTIDRDAGVTPMAIACAEFGTSCYGQAQSAAYPIGADELSPTHEWVTPTVEERNDLRRRSEHAMLDHVMRGGLMLRRIVVPDGER
jgi:hypothetical protein